MPNKSKNIIYITVSAVLVVICLAVVGVGVSLLKVNAIAHANTVGCGMGYSAEAVAAHNVQYDKNSSNAAQVSVGYKMQYGTNRADDGQNNLTEITFNSNGGTVVAAISQAIGTSVAAPSAPTRAGYTFLHWAFNDAIYQFTTMPSQSITLTAIWSANPDTPYSIAFYKKNLNSNTFTEVFADRVSEVGTTDAYITYTIDTAKYPNYKVNLALSSSDIQISADGNTVFAVYYEPKIYTATFDATGGTCGISELRVSYGETITIPTAVKTGYSFVGWRASGTLITSATYTYTYSTNTTFKAEWLAREIAINFNSHGGTSQAAISINYGELVTPPTEVPTKQNYKFTGWYLDEACTQKVNFEEQTFTADTTLYAAWESDTGYVWAIVFVIIVLVSFVAITIGLVINKN